MHCCSAATGHDTGGKFEPVRLLGWKFAHEFVFLGRDFYHSPCFTQHPLFPVDVITSGSCGGCVVSLDSPKMSEWKFGGPCYRHALIQPPPPKADLLNTTSLYSFFSHTNPVDHGQPKHMRPLQVRCANPSLVLRQVFDTAGCPLECGKWWVAHLSAVGGLPSLRAVGSRVSFRSPRPLEVRQ